MIVTLELQVATRCTACSVLTPMVGIRNIVTCRNCAATIDFEAKVKDSREGGVRYPFGGYYDTLAEAALVLKDGEKCQDASDSQGSPTTLKRAASPACLSCNRALPIPAAGVTTMRCDGCSDVIGVRWPDAETRKWDPRIRCIVGDGLAATQTTREAKTQGTLISCGQCGAPLTGDQTDRRRARTCPHCTAVNYLGDAAMLALFPQPEWHRSYLVYEVDDPMLLRMCRSLIGEGNHYFLEDDQTAAVEAVQAKALAAARTSVIAAAKAGELEAGDVHPLAIDATLTAAEADAIDRCFDDDARLKLCEDAAPALLARWAASASSDLRKRVAAHPRCPRDQLIALAGDADNDVRAKAAARPELPSDLLAKLRKDPDEDVQRAVKKNPSYKPGFFEKLLG